MIKEVRLNAEGEKMSFWERIKAVFNGNEGNRVWHYSDEGKRIRQVETGIVYDDAIDTIPCKYTYEETNEPINNEEK